jgi:hypothetical protein
MGMTRRPRSSLPVALALVAAAVLSGCDHTGEALGPSYRDRDLAHAVHVAERTWADWRTSEVRPPGARGPGAERVVRHYCGYAGDDLVLLSPSSRPLPLRVARSCAAP